MEIHARWLQAWESGLPSTSHAPATSGTSRKAICQNERTAAPRGTMARKNLTPEKVNGGMSCTPSLMKSQVDPQIKVRTAQIAATPARLMVLPCSSTA